MFKLLPILFFAILLFSGCLNYKQETHLYADGSGKMKIEYWAATKDSLQADIYNRLGIFSEDSIRSEFTSSYLKIEEISVYSDSTDSTTHAVISLSFENIDSLVFTKAFEEYDFKLEDGAAGQKIFSQFIPPIATGFGIDDTQFIVNYVYSFGGEIITHNAQTKKGNILTWMYTLAEIGSGKTISVTFKPYKLKETPYWIYILSGLVLLVVIVFLFRKKKS